MAAKKSAKKVNEKFTTSKKIILASCVIGVALSAVLVIGAFRGYDMTTVGIVAAAAYAEIAAANAFYFWKAKKENVMKIAVGSVKDNPELSDKIAAVISALGGVA